MLRMPSKKEELERMDLNILAVFCQKVAEARNDSSFEARHARQLKYEWTLLLVRQINSSQVARGFDGTLVQIKMHGQKIL
jgi:hypothetical protein